MSYNEITKNRFDAEAISYDSRMTWELNRNLPLYALVAQELKKKALQTPGVRLVVSDICCGNGFALSKILLQVSEDIYTQGIDFSREMIKTALERSIYDECICHDVTSPWSFSRQSDLAFCIRDALTNISEDFDLAVANMVSNMKPGSILIIDGNFLSSTMPAKLPQYFQELYEKFCAQFPEIEYERLERDFPEYLYYANEENVYPSRLKLFRVNELPDLLKEKGVIIRNMYGLIRREDKGKLLVFPHWEQGVDTIISEDGRENSSIGIESIVAVGVKK